MTTDSYLMSAIKCYLNSNEGYKRFLIGENPINLVLDMKDTRFYDSGVIKLEVSLGVWDDKFDVIDANIYVDLKFFNFYEELIDELLDDDYELIKLIVTSNRDGLTSITVHGDIDSITFSVNDKDKKPVTIEHSGCQFELML